MYLSGKSYSSTVKCILGLDIYHKMHFKASFLYKTLTGKLHGIQA